MALNIGQILQNRYRVVGLIGQGGFGAVYRAWDTSVNQPVALKENLDTSVEAQRQFQREAAMMAGLRHVNLARVTDHFLIPGQGQYLVMDFVEGQSLGQILVARGRPFSEAEVLPWVEQICDALNYLHSRHPPIIHRDVKPQNIIITADGQAVLVDFGISKIYDPALSTTVGAKAVTPGYSPPEQYGSGATDARTDVYALGATLYMLLTGQEPPESIDLMIGNKVMLPLRQLNTQISAGLEQAILKAMNTTTSHRFQSVTDLKAALLSPERFREKETKLVTPDRQGLPKWAWVVMLLVGVLSGVALLMPGLRHRESPAAAIVLTAITETAISTTFTALAATPERIVVTVLITPILPTATPTTAIIRRATSTPRSIVARATIAAGFRVRINNQYSSVNVRRGPDTRYEIIATLFAGDEVIVLAKNQDETWYNVEMDDGRRGWISVGLTEQVDAFVMADVDVAATIPSLPTATRTPSPTPTQLAPTSPPPTLPPAPTTPPKPPTATPYPTTLPEPPTATPPAYPYPTTPPKPPTATPPAYPYP